MKTIRTTYPFSGFWDTRQGGRPENQDSCGFIDTPRGLMAIVCDGMGGGPAGRNASVLAVKIIAEYGEESVVPVSEYVKSMKEAIINANN